MSGISSEELEGHVKNYMNIYSNVAGQCLRRNPFVQELFLLLGIDVVDRCKHAADVGRHLGSAKISGNTETTLDIIFQTCA